MRAMPKVEGQKMPNTPNSRDSGSLPGSPNLKEVARRAGVGLGSASRVLSGHASASPAMQKRVLRAAEELGYVPNMLARGLKRRSSLAVGFVASDIANPLVADIYRGAEEVLTKAGYSMVLTDSDDTPHADGERLRTLRQRQVEGIIMLSVTEDDPVLLSEIAKLEEPLIVIDREFPLSPMRSAVLTDHFSGVYDATRHLLSLGHRHIALVTGRDVRPARERRRAMEGAIADGEPKTSLVVLEGNLSEAHGARAIRVLMERQDRPTAVILGGNQLLVGALLELRKHHVTVGSDLSLVTCDEQALGQLNDPPVAAVVRDVRRIGHVAAELFLEQRAGSKPRIVSVPTSFVPTKSCGRIDAVA